MVGQSDWLPMTMAIGGAGAAADGRSIAQILASRRGRPLPHAIAHFLEMLYRPAPIRRASGDDVGEELVLQRRNAVPQHQLAFLQPLDLQAVRARLPLQGID